MKFTKLSIMNFLTIGHAEVSLADRGLVLVQGKNEDDGSATSNGAGKSSIADALAWALFGTTARGVTGDAVVNKTAKKNCQVSVFIDDGATSYQITRFRKNAIHKNTLKVHALVPGGAPTDLSKGTDRETQEVVDRIIGCSYEVFRAAVYCGQEQMPDLPGMTDKQLKLLIEEAAGISRLERAYEAAREKSREAEVALVKATNLIVSLQKAIDDGNNTITTLLADATAWEASQKSKLDMLEKKVRDATVSFGTLAGKLKGFDRAGKLAQRATLKADLDNYEKNQAALSVVRTQFSKATRDADIKETAVRSMAETVRGIKDRIAHTVDKIGKPCEMCGKPHTAEDRDAVVAIQTEKLESAVPKVKEAKQAWDAAKVIVDELVKKVAELEAYPKPTELLSKISTLDAEIADFDRQLADLRRLKLDVENAQAAHAAVKKETNPIEPIIARSRKELAEVTKRHGDADKALAAAMRDANIMSAAAKVFGPAGVRAHVLDTVTPFLNDRTAEYLTTLSDGNITAAWSTLTKTKAGELKERFCIDVANKTGAESFSGLSGGEKRKVRLASMLALQDLVASRAIKPIDLWVGDEVDDALDPGGLERLMTILEQRARERGTVLLISHAELQDWVDNVVTVTKTGGYSTVEGALEA